MLTRSLSRMSEDEDDVKEKVGPTVRYLQKLGVDHLEVVLAASEWVFEQDKEAGLQVRRSLPLAL